MIMMMMMMMAISLLQIMTAGQLEATEIFV
jgi:hypothetical protein